MSEYVCLYIEKRASTEQDITVITTKQSKWLNKNFLPNTSHCLSVIINLVSAWEHGILVSVDPIRSLYVTRR